MNKLKLLKGIVILLASLIVLGITAVIVGLINKEDKPAITFPARESLVTTTVSGTDTVLISEPQGSRITSATGCGDNICLLITDGGEAPRLAILSAKGSLIRKVKLNWEK